MFLLSNTEFIIAIASFGAIVPAGVCWSCWQTARTHFHAGIGTARLPVLFAALTVVVSVLTIAGVVWMVARMADTERVMSVVVVVALAMLPCVLCVLMLGSVVKYELLRRGPEAWMAAHPEMRGAGPHDLSAHFDAEWRQHPERWCVCVARRAPDHRGVAMRRDGAGWLCCDDGLMRALVEDMLKAGVERVDRSPTTGGRAWYGPMDRLEDWIEGSMRRGW